MDMSTATSIDAATIVLQLLLVLGRLLWVTTYSFYSTVGSGLITLNN